MTLAAHFYLLNIITLYACQDVSTSGSPAVGTDMIIVEMKKHFQLRAIEWWSAGAMASWGFWSLLFPTMFKQNPACYGLLELAPQHVWGLAAVTAGCLRLCALFVNGMWTRTPAIRWLTSMVSIFIWFLVTAAFANSPVMNVGIIVYAWHMIADMYSAFRSASDFIEAETQRKLKSLSVGEVPISGEGTNVRRISAG